MSVKYFCDRCRLPMRRADHQRVKARMGRYFVEVMIGTDNTYNLGLLCHPCVRTIVAKGKNERASA